MEGMQPPNKPGILPPNSGIVSSNAYPRIPTDATGVAGGVDSGTPFPQNDPNNIPTVSPERQDLSGALYKLAGTFIGQALEEGVGDGTGKVAAGIAEFAGSGVNIMKDRWYKENASNFNNLVFKPFQQANQRAFEDYNMQLDAIMGDPNVQPEEKFAAARALQYKLSMTGKNLSLQVQMAAANPQFASNPYVKNTMAAMLNHQEGVIGQLAESHKVAMEDDVMSAKIAADQSTIGFNQARVRQAEQEMDITEKFGARQAEADIKAREAEANQRNAAALFEGHKRAQSGDFGGLDANDENVKRAVDFVLSDDKEQAGIEKHAVAPYVEETARNIMTAGEQTEGEIKKAFEAWMAKKESKPATPEDYNTTKIEFFNSNEGRRTLEMATDGDPMRLKVYIAYLQKSGTDANSALLPMDIASRELSDKKLTNAPTFEGLLRDATRNKATQIKKEQSTVRASELASASGNPKLSEAIRTGQGSLREKGFLHPDYAPPEETQAKIQDVQIKLQKAIQLKAATEKEGLKDAAAAVDERIAILQGKLEKLNEALRKEQ